MNQNINYQNLSLPEINGLIKKKINKVVVTGNNLSISEIISVSREKAKVEITADKKILKRVQECYEHMLMDVRNGIPIYGCNTGYGARASRVLTEGTAEERINLAKEISEGITHVDVSIGPAFSPEIVRGSMLIRINMMLKGVSAVKLDDLRIYEKMLNNQITPVVNQYGGIGASGDLAHNSRVLSAARQLPGTLVWDKNGNKTEAKEALVKAGIAKLELDPKAGLGLVNGDNVSTSLAAHLAVDTLKLLLLSCVASAMTIEALKGTDRSFHPLLSKVRKHSGQEEVASIMRNLLSGSKLAFQEMSGHQKRDPGIKVQDGYSLRGLSQYHAVNFEKIKQYLNTITINANSASDNPLWVTPEFVTEGEDPWKWVSGGNFLAMHMVEVMDGLRKTLTQIVKLSDRHLARMVMPHESNGLPANLSDPEALTQCSFKGVQIQSGMLEVYSSLLSIPVSTFFGVHEEGNQDITSHALTSGILGLENLRLARYSIAQNLVAITQAVDLRGGGGHLSKKTHPIYQYIRDHVKYVKKERPLHNDIEAIYQLIVDDTLIDLIQKKSFS